MKFEFGDIVRFTYKHQVVDASTGDTHKEILVLHPNWNHKIHALDLKRLTPAEREVLEAVLDPEQKDKPHRLPLVNDIKRRMDPAELIRNPVAFYTKFVKPFLRGKDAYRQYVPSLMNGITKVKDAKIKTGKKPVENPLFGPKPMQGTDTKQPSAIPKAHTAIDIMAQNAKAKGLK